jgi:hypothetical protein
VLKQLDAPAERTILKVMLSPVAANAAGTTAAKATIMASVEKTDFLFILVLSCSFSLVLLGLICIAAGSGESLTKSNLRRIAVFTTCLQLQPRPTLVPASSVVLKERKRNLQEFSKFLAKKLRQ